MPLGIDLWSETPRVFISHSSRRRTASELRTTDTPNRHYHRKKFLALVLEQLDTKLTAAGFEVWIDRSRIDPGDEFEDKIHFALQSCDIAIILVDLDALDASYVRKEATILMWQRQSGHPQVIPVLLGGVTEQDVASSTLGYPVGLNTISMLRPGIHKQNAAAAAALTDQIVAALAGPRPQRVSTPVARWIQDFAHYISGISANRLDRVAERLGVSAADWARTRDRHTAVAGAMLGADMTQAYQALQQLVSLMDEDRQKTNAVRRALPLWVDLDAAKAVVDVTALPPDRRVLAVSTRAMRLGEHVIQRATCSAPEYGTVRLPDVAGEDGNAELLERYDTTLRRLLHLSRHDTPDEIAREIDSMGGAVFALFRCENLRSETAVELLARLRRRFPGVVFVALARKDSRVWRQLDVPHVYGTLNDAQERSARKYVSRAASLIGEEILVDSDE